MAIRNMSLVVHHFSKKWISVVASLLCVFILSIILFQNGVPDQISVTTRKTIHLDGYIATHVNTKCNHTHVDVSGKSHSQSREDYALFTKYFSSPIICGGVYVEIGALDGIRYSNTKIFEDYLGWNGLLIEAEPSNAAKLKKNRPKSFVVPQGVCPRGQKTISFMGRGPTGGMPSEMSRHHIKHSIESNAMKNITCQPLSSMLKDSGILAVDFFILDVEGAELKVLETMDWNIPVKAFVVEMDQGTQEKDQKVINILAEHGYRKALWNIRDFCLPKKGCTHNMVFEHPNYTYRVN